MTLFASSSSKLKWYIMPIYPFLYIICAYFVFNLFNFLIIKKIKYQVIGLLLYLFFFLNLSYLYSIRGMVYTSDFNLKQASLLIRNNSLPNVDMTYIDKIDYPIALFYNEKPNFEITQFSILKEILPERVNHATSITIITGKNRFESLKRTIPSLQIIEENDDFVLSSLNYPLN
jgi:hypothetical protein